MIYAQYIIKLFSFQNANCQGIVVKQYIYLLLRKLSYIRMVDERYK